MAISDWLPFTARILGRYWTPRPGDTGMDLDGGERIVRPATGRDFFPWPLVNLNPVSGLLPKFDATVLQIARSKMPSGPDTGPQNNPGTVIFPTLPKSRGA